MMVPRKVVCINGPLVVADDGTIWMWTGDKWQETKRPPLPDREIAGWSGAITPSAPGEGELPKPKPTIAYMTDSEVARAIADGSLTQTKPAKSPKKGAK